MLLNKNITTFEKNKKVTHENFKINDHPFPVFRF
jgi:hypothetical protein